MTITFVFLAPFAVQSRTQAAGFMLHWAGATMRIPLVSHIVIVALGVVLCSCAQEGTGDAKIAVTEYQVQHCPITISATCLGNFAKGSSWYLSVNSAGQAEVALLGVKNTRRQFQVPADQWRALQNAVLDERFFELADDYGDLVVDGSTRTLTISVGHLTKTVRVHYLMHHARNDTSKLRESSRALRVMMLIRAWISDDDAVDLTPYDQRVLEAAGR